MASDRPLPGRLREGSARHKIRDPYADLLRDTRSLGREQVAARDAWYGSLGLERKEETLFEIEMLLKGLVCFVNPRNYPGPPRRAPTVALDFREELVIARQCIGRIVGLCRQLLGSRDRSYMFTRYLETLLPEDGTHTRLSRSAFAQESPEDSLVYLRHGLTLIGEVIDGVLRLDQVPYRLFHSTLAMVQREIQRNQFFNPLVALEFRPEFDRVRSAEVLEAIQAVDNDAAHRVVALAYLSCFRMLRYTQLIQATYQQDPSGIRRAYILLAVLRSDARAIVHYLRNRATAILSDGFERELMKVPAREISSRFDALAREAQRLSALRGSLEALAAALRVEIRGIFEVRVPPPGAGASPGDIASSLATSMASLREMLQAGVTQLTVMLRGETDPERLFEDSAARRSVGERLRRDVWMFNQVLRAFIAKARVTPGALDQWSPHGSVQYVREFLGYFRAMGYQLLCASDYPQFDRFLATLGGLHEADFLEPALLSSAVSECEMFQAFLGETFERISQREEVKHLAFDKRAAAETLKLYLGARG